jgi:hypothetical protein
MSSKPRPRSISKPRLSANKNKNRLTRSQSRNISRYEPHEKIMQDLMKENERLKGLLKLNDEKEVKNSMKGLNKMVDIEELKRELDVLRKRDEIRTRMLTEDLRAFEEKRQEILLAIDKRQLERSNITERQRGVEEDKLHYTSTVIDHLKMVLYGISPIDLCWIKYADEGLEGAERTLRTWGKTIHPYKVQYKTDTFLTDVTREEFIDSIKKGKTTTPPTYIEEKDNCLNKLKQNLLIKTIDWLGRYHG